MTTDLRKVLREAERGQREAYARLSAAGRMFLLSPTLIARCSDADRQAALDFRLNELLAATVERALRRTRARTVSDSE